MRPGLDYSDLPRAAALAYTADDVAAKDAPRVVAKGQWRLAEEIIRRAHAAGVPVHESRELVALLMQVDLDERIPPALYVAVAEVLAWVYKLEGRCMLPAQDAPRQENAPNSPWE